jgi:hypothetical protein
MGARHGGHVSTVVSAVDGDDGTLLSSDDRMHLQRWAPWSAETTACIGSDKRLGLL